MHLIAGRLLTGIEHAAGGHLATGHPGAELLEGELATGQASCRSTALRSSPLRRRLPSCSRPARSTDLRAVRSGSAVESALLAGTAVCVGVPAGAAAPEDGGHRCSLAG